MKKFPCIESTEEFTVGPFHIRLWINQSEVMDRYPMSHGVARTIRTFVSNSTCNRAELIEYCRRFPDLNAMQIQETNWDKIRSGVVVYFVDFVGDVHG